MTTVRWRLSANVNAALSEFQAARLAAEAYILTIEQEQLEAYQARIKAAQDKIAGAQGIGASEDVAKQIAVIENQFVTYRKMLEDSQGGGIFLQQEVYGSCASTGGRSHPSSSP